MMETHLLSADQRETLTGLAETANEKLETAAQSAVNHAFNLGCTVSLLPGAIMVLAAFLLSRASWVTAIVAAIFVAMAALGFANLAAYVAKSRTTDRTYQRDIQPEIERTLKRNNLTRQSFDHLAAEVLPQGAALRNYLSSSAASSNAASGAAASSNAASGAAASSSAAVPPAGEAGESDPSP